MAYDTLPSSSRPKRLIILVGTCLAFLYCVSTSHRASNTENNPIPNVYNRTLGFEKIYSINFPERTDKRDALTLAASYTGMDIEFLPGRSFESVPKKSAPTGWNFEKESQGALGCWRAHMDAMQKIVADRIQSALILEDDTDWDVSLKSQLHSFAEGSRAILDTPTTNDFSPYGQGWDFLWLGNCRMGVRDDETKFYVIEDDLTVAPASKRYTTWSSKRRPPESLQNHTRLVFKPNYGMCGYAYAVTYDGARKLLSSLSVTSRNEPVDLGWRDMCSGRWGIPFSCVGVYPSILSSHRFAGPQSRDSDLNNKSDRWHDEYTWDVVYSTIQNAPRWVLGETDTLAQWPDEVAVPRIGLDGLKAAKGSLKILDRAQWENTQEGIR